jgi:hypothetical protein
MATAYLARTIRCVINAHRGGDKRANVLHFQVPGTSVTPAEVDAVAADVKAWTNQLYRMLISSQVIFDDITATDASGENGYQKTESMTGIIGGATNAPAPGNACAVVTLHTAQPGRSGRGRVYVMDGPAEAFTNADTVLASYQTQLQAAFDLLVTPTNGDPGYSLAVGSRKGLCSFDVTSAVAHSYIGSQKDRLPGHRRHKKPTA